MTALGRTVRIATCLVVVAIAAVVPAGAQTDAAAGGDPLQIYGVGDDVTKLIGERFSNALGTSSSGVSLNYTPQGGRDGRAAWARGEADFAVSGRPRTPEDDAALAKRGVTAIEAPIAVSAVAFTYVPARGVPLVFEQPGATEDDPVTFTPFPPPLKLPARTITNVFLGSAAKLNLDPDFAPLYAPAAVQDQLRAPIGVTRADPNAFNYYIQQYMLDTSPQEFSTIAASLSFPVPSESWYNFGIRSGDAGIATVVSSGLSPVSGASGSPLLGPLTPNRANDEVQNQLTRPNPVPIYVAALQNGLQQWVQPTTDSISKAAAGAVNAASSSGGSPEPLWALHATSADADGSYPLTWISNVMVQSSGLPIGNTNAIATMIRYAASDAAAADATAIGEGVLPVPMRLKALAAADRVVEGNCVGTGRAVKVATDGGTAWPSGVPVPAGGVKVCVDTTPPSTTTTAPPTAQTVPPTSPTVVASEFKSSGGSAGTSNGGSGLSGDLGSIDPLSDTGDGSSGAGEVASGAPAGSAPAAPTQIAAVASKLPLGMPDDGRKTLDRLTTMLMGGLAFLAVRSVLSKRASSS